MDHIVLNIRNEERMIVFYTEVLKLESERLEEYRSGNVPFPSVRLNPDTIIDLFPKQMWIENETPGQGHMNLNHLCLTISHESWDSLHKRLTSNHIQIEDGPVSRWGAHGIGTSIYFRDPDENLVEARYY